MFHNRFKFSPPSLHHAIVSLLLCLTLFGATQVIGSALAANLRQTNNGASSTPPYLNYQGTLRDAEGKAISGVHKLTFRVYADVTAPMPESLWMEVHNDVTIRDGHFSVLLGDSTALAPTIFSSPDRFIGIALDELDEMVPRQRFASVPYAFNASALEGLPLQNFSLVGHVHNGLSVPGSTSNEALTVTNSGNVGIGTTNPAEKLHVANGSLRVQSANKVLDLRTDGAAVDLAAPTSDLYIKSTGGNKFVILNHSGGRVGVNTTNPGAALDVNGDVHVQGTLRLGSQYRAPVMIRRYTALPADSTTIIEGISPSEYDCTVGAWSIRMDVDENDAGPYTLWTFVEGAEPTWVWKLRARFWTDSNETSNADVICYLRGVISEFQGDRGNQGFN